MRTLVLCGSPALGMPASPSRLIDPTTPLAGATDLGLTRGDGIFESVGIHHGRMHDLEPHLERLAQSARLMDLPAPDLAVFRDAISQAVDALLAGVDHVPVTALCKIVYTRGEEAAAAVAPGRPLGFALAYEFPDPTEARRRGTSALTLTRGYPLGIGAVAPWLTVGAKTLSYSVNMAALRHAAAQGVEEVVFTTTDGFVLEAPRSTVVMRRGDVVTTPSIEGGLLHGTAQRAAFDAFEALGLSTEYRDVRVEELAGADALWLADSAFLLRPLHHLDGRRLEVDEALTGAAIDLMLAAGS
ncbi:aminotransferase class IV [Demequina capsici]|uniref:Aminotransferase class IV n=1 Tax=Demequina capsici TaxID=3075620 RepID=A0AA96FA41_9MICO|nr:MULTISPECIES: aminotransferase class IV [unclassified Demequina]WNM23472.1 aminotransferase class IV [Demequina sp. OYTSA14]WNM26349.1 aminotransferase class IV [Demequina sp. PMTSA13]